MDFRLWLPGGLDRQVLYLLHLFASFSRTGNASWTLSLGPKKNERCVECGASQLLSAFLPGCLKFPNRRSDGNLHRL